MKETPILFTGEMVRAILDGRKTLTSRLIKPQPTKNVIQGDDGAWYDADCINPGTPLKCKYKPGTRLWVKETFHPHKSHQGPASYRATWKDEDPDEGWKPSIFMPRWASRITLEVVRVWPSRLQEMTEEMAKEEGCGWAFKPSERLMLGIKATYLEGYKQLWDSINAAPRRKKVKGKTVIIPGHPWESNPWVWRIQFKRI